MLIGVSMLVLALLTFLAGLFAFRIKSRWCRTCGASLSCVDCRDRARLHRTAS